MPKQSVHVGLTIFLKLIALFSAYPEEFGGGLAKVTYSGKLYDKCQGLPFTQERRFDSGFVFETSRSSLINFHYRHPSRLISDEDIEHVKLFIANSQLMQVPMI